MRKSQHTQDTPYLSVFSPKSSEYGHFSRNVKVLERGGKVIIQFDNFLKKNAIGN